MTQIAKILTCLDMSSVGVGEVKWWDVAVYDFSNYAGFAILGPCWDVLCLSPLDWMTWGSLYPLSVVNPQGNNWLLIGTRQ